MATRKDRGFRFPLDKYDDRIALHTNFKYLQEYLNYIRRHDQSGYTVIVAASNSRNVDQAHYVCDGSGDQTIINAAIADVQAAGGGTVKLLAGDYSLTGSVSHLTNHEVWIQGEGDATRLHTSSGITMIQLIAPAFTTPMCVVSDLQLDGNNVATIGISISTFFEVRNVTIKDINGDGIYCLLNTSNPYRHMIFDNLFENCTNGVHTDKIGHALIARNFFHVNTVAIYLDSSGSKFVTENHFHGNGTIFDGGLTGKGSEIAFHNMNAGTHMTGDHSGLTLDHGSLTGLADDDHAQYLKEKASGGIAAEVPEHTHESAAEAGVIDVDAFTDIMLLGGM